MCSVTPAEIVIMVAVTAGAITDIRTKKIYNWITFPAALAGLAANVWSALPCQMGGTFVEPAVINAAVAPLIWSIVGCALGLLITTVPRSIKQKKFLHAGDAKMWAAVGACLQPAEMLICWFYFSLAFGLISRILIARAAPADRATARKALIPVCPAIAIGVYLGIFFGKPLMHFMGFNWYHM